MKSDFIKECGYMSLKELAKRANVSTATVSKAFSGSKDISEKTRRLVFDTAKDMGIFEKYHKERASKIVMLSSLCMVTQMSRTPFCSARQA